LITADGTAAMEAVRSGRAQLGVAALDATPRDLSAELRTRAGQVLAMPKKHPLAARRSIRLKGLAGAELIAPPAGPPHRTMLSQLLQSALVEWQVAVEASGWEWMLHLVHLGMGLAVLNACCRMPTGVVARPVPDLPTIQYHLVHRPDGVIGGADILRRHLLQHAETWRQA